MAGELAAKLCKDGGWGERGDGSSKGTVLRRKAKLPTCKTQDTASRDVAEGTLQR